MIIMRGKAIYAAFIVCLLISAQPILPAPSENKIGLTPHELFHKIQHGGITLIDIRNFSSYAEEHIKGAINLPFSSCDSCFLERLNKYKNVVLYCQNGRKSREIAISMVKNGGIAYLKGGINAWKRAGLPVVNEKICTGCIPLDNKTIKPEKPGKISGYPPSWDWRDAVYKGKRGDWTTSIKSQGNCGSCWDFAAMGALEAIINIREGCPNLDVDLSEQYLLSCPPNSGGCSGWNAYFAYQYMKRHGGALPESCFPYQADDTVPCSDKCPEWRDKLIPIAGYGWYSNPSRDFIKSLVYSHGPVVAAMQVYEDFLSYKGGVYRHRSGDFVDWHQVVIVGYDDARQCWICKNSWGTYWGENGWFRIGYGECMIESEIVYVDYDASAVNWPPRADAGDGYYGEAGESIKFVSHSYDPDGDIVNYTWDFGDGSIAYGSVVSHVYAKNGIYEVKLTVRDSTGKSDDDETIAFIGIWDEMRKRVYEMDASGNVEFFYPYTFSSHIKNLKVWTSYIGDDYYKINFDGWARGRIKILLGSWNFPFNLYLFAAFFPLKIDGSITFQKFGYGIETIDMEIKGMTWFMLLPIPIVLPLPYTIHIVASFDPPYEMLPVAPSPGKIWNAESNASLTITASTLLRLISKTIDVENLPSFMTFIYMQCIDRENISVPAGNFDVYKIIVLDSIEVYYSMAVFSIIKAQLSPDFQNINFLLKLKSID